jgi:hypothetical protein
MNRYQIDALYEEPETVGYFVPKGVDAVCLHCAARRATLKPDVLTNYVHIKENYKPLSDICCDVCGEVILAKKVPDKILDNKAKK